MTYTNYKLGISKKDFKPANDNKPEGLNIEVVSGRGNYNIYIDLLKQVGGPWLWDRRPEYANDNRALKAKITQPLSSIHLFKCFEDIIGYAWTIDRPDMSNDFTRVAQIENFGLVPEFNAKGYGSYFLNETFSYLFNQGYTNIHLESRSTNHEKVIPFYERNGMIIKEVQTNLPNDLIL